MTEQRLKITEIFHSLQGETTFSGLPTVFIRLTGCPLRCVWCDTEYSFGGGAWMNIDEIIEQVKTYQTPYVCVTGGEPLSQKRCQILLDQLIENDFTVSLETSGALPIDSVNDKVNIIMDLKPPASGEESKNDYGNIQYLSSKDQVKFVIKDRSDYLWSKQQLEKYKLSDICEVLFSPVADEMPVKDLAQWILDDKLKVRFQVQLHKIIWDNAQGR